MKKLALMLALCLLISMLPSPVLADEIVSEPIDAVPEEVVAQLGESGLAVSEPEPTEEAGEAEEGTEEGWFVPEFGTEPEADATPTPEPSAEATAAPGEEPTPEPTAEPTPEPEPTPAAPQLSAEEVTLGVGETLALTATLPEGVIGAVSYRSDNADVAKVGADGTITAIAPGEAAILAGVEGGAEAVCLVHVKNAPDAVRFAEAELTLGKGETLEDVEIILGSGDGECAGAYTLSSGNRKIVKITADGGVQGVRTGTATLTVKTYNGLKATCPVTVKKAPYDLALALDAETLGVGEEGAALLTMAEDAAGRATFVSDKPGVVEVDPATGALRAVKKGTAVITATAYNGASASATVTVKKAPKQVTLKPAEMTLGVGMQLPIRAVLNSGSAGSIRLTSAKKRVATVKNGVVKGVKAGETVIRAETYNGLTAECAVVVKPAPTSVTLPAETIYIGLGETLTLTPDVGDSASTFTYTSSNKSRVRAYADGRIKGLKTGSAYVKVKTYNGKSCRAKIVVRKAPEWVKITPRKAGMAVGEVVQLTAKLPSKRAGKVTFASSKPDVAQVDAQTGTVTALAAGSATITAEAFNGVRAKCKITVYPQPEWIEVGDTSLKLGVGQVWPLSVEISPGSRSPIAYESADSAVARVNAEGVITAVGEGRTEISVNTNAEGVSAKVTVKVVPAPDTMRLRKKKVTLNVGETYTIKPVLPSGTAAGYTYETEDAGIAAVSESGEVFAAGRGATTITVTTHNGLTATMTVKVYDPTYPESVTITNAPIEMTVGDTLQLELTCEPETAEPGLVWESNDEEIVTVSNKGVIKALSSGYVYVRATSTRNPEIFLEFKMSVARPGQTLVIPARQTKIAGVPENLEKIDAIRKVSIREINQLLEAGTISAGDAARRREIVNNIFKDYAFPWMTPEYQPYWKWENSEGGVKDFKPGIMYYGLPYISGSGNNRRYNRAKALSESRYTDTGDGYYMLNRGNLLNGKYVGNDCSGLVDQAIWGTNSSHSGDRTADIAVSSAYKTITDVTKMRPGDLICKGNAHVIMFLYYTNDEHTKMMFIENGGSEPGTNTVHCLVGRIYYYQWAGYRIRRLRELG